MKKKNTVVDLNDVVVLREKKLIFKCLTLQHVMWVMWWIKGGPKWLVNLFNLLLDPLCCHINHHHNLDDDHKGYSTTTGGGSIINSEEFLKFYVTPSGIQA